MPTKLQTVRESVIMKLIVDLLILGGSFLASKLLVALSANQWAFVSDHVWEITILGTLLIAALTLFLWRRFDRFRPAFHRLHPEYEVLSKDISYTYYSREDLEYVKIITIKALRDGVEGVKDKYNWTGSGRIKIDSLSEEHTIRLLGQRNIWQAYEIVFNKRLKKGETQRVAVKWTLSDPEHRARPFISQSVDYPTKLLRFRVRVPSSFNVQHPRKIIRATIDTLDVLEERDDEVLNGEIEWSIHNPKLYHCYELTWIDPNATPVGAQADTVAGNATR